MEKRKEEIIQEIIKLKTQKTLESKNKIQKLQQELDNIDYEKQNKKDL
jgi:hypothetical protein